MRLKYLEFKKKVEEGQDQGEGKTGGEAADDDKERQRFLERLRKREYISILM